MKPKKEAPVVQSVALRQWTRGVSFTLAMGKTQVAALVAIAISQDSVFLIGCHHKLCRSFVTAGDGLIDRGLVTHARRMGLDTIPKPRPNAKVGSLWRLTPAGEHVVELLKIAGIFDELKAEFIASQPAGMRVG